MTREEAKKLLPIMQAFAEGKTIEYRTNNRSWVDLLDNDIEINALFEYRIKPEPKYRPFRTQEECLNEMLKHQPLGWCRDKEGGALLIVTAICDQYIYFDGNPTEIDKTFGIYEFLDGTPFGIKE